MIWDVMTFTWRQCNRMWSKRIMYSAAPSFYLNQLCVFVKENALENVFKQPGVADAEHNNVNRPNNSGDRVFCRM